MKKFPMFLSGILALFVSTHEVCRGALPDNEPGGDAEGARLAIQQPDEYAWQLFFYINRQAQAGTAGKADLTKATLKDYDPDTDVVWETWALASSEGTEFAEVFLANGVPPPDWKDLDRGSQKKAKKLDRTFTLIGEQVLRASDGQSPHGRLAAPETDFDSDEVRVNEATLETIKSKGLYNRQGLADAFRKAVDSKNRDLIQFPTASKEVKARWGPIEEDQKGQYHWKTINGQTYGLLAFHIISKDIPMWYWTDFIHESLESGEPPDSMKDSTTRGPNATHGQNGVRDETKGGKWEHYRLKGSQVTFHDARGNDVIVGNELIEFGNASVSSCMTCHAMAGVDAQGNGMFSPFITGAPPPIQFGPDDDIQRIQTDFLYSIPLRAQATQNPAAAGNVRHPSMLRAAKMLSPVDTPSSVASGGEITSRILEGFPEHKMQRLQQREGELKLLERAGMMRPQSVFRLADRWEAGQTIKVAFKGGTPQLHKLIAEQASEWMKYANLHFDFGFNPGTGRYRSWGASDIEYSADIRISFDKNGYYSNVGRDSVDVSLAPAGEESMNFDGFDQGLPLDWRGTVLHEFGHAIGLEHEHQHPAGGCDFRWENDPGYVNTTGPRGEFLNDNQGRRPGIYTLLSGYPNFWSRQKVDFNLKQLPDSDAFSITGPLDKNSIMLYYFEPWMFRAGTQSPCYIVNEAGKLSEDDQRGAREMFPSTLGGIQRVEQQRDTAINALQKAKMLSVPLQKQLERMKAIR